MKKIIGRLEWVFRHGVVYPLLRLIFRNSISDEPLELSTVRKLLILRYDRIGDMIVTTPIFRLLKEVHPGLHIGVVTSELNAALIRNNPSVDAIYVLHGNWFRLWKEVKRARKERYEVVLNFIFNRTTSGGILANLIAPEGFKVGQGDPKYRFYFNRLLSLERSGAHMVETLADFVRKVFNIPLTEKGMDFELHIDDRSRAAVDWFLKKQKLARRSAADHQGTAYLVFNLSATDRVRRMSALQAVALDRFLSGQTDVRAVLIHAPGDEEMENVVRTSSCIRFPEQGTASLTEIASLIEGAVCVITPDTAIVHFASAMKTPVLGFFTPLQGMHEWLPFNVMNELVTAPAGMPVSSLAPEVMKEEIKTFLHRLPSHSAVQ